ncbi:unnamed protein product [Ceratitis capitata]|uniref:(Mediterranean fruit fly) hypothetical protein n=1 Tax=Ceratitis capitata TaxID=7213 RepID=W8BJ28_CERCA|nr:unnamed protein product [Ceratitis capitata]
MSGYFKIIFVLFCVIYCTLSTPMKPPAFPICIDNVCHCGSDAHEEVLAGRKYCATNSREPCPMHSVRLSKNHCECRKGYKFIDKARTKCGKEIKVDLPLEIDNFEKSAHVPNQNAEIKENTKESATNKYQSETDTQLEEVRFEPDLTTISVQLALNTKADEERGESPIIRHYAVGEENRQSAIQFDQSITTKNLPKSTTNATQRNLVMNLLIAINCIYVLAWVQSWLLF